MPGRGPAGARRPPCPCGHSRARRRAARGRAQRAGSCTCTRAASGQPARGQSCSVCHAAPRCVTAWGRQQRSLVGGGHCCAPAGLTAASQTCGAAVLVPGSSAGAQPAACAQQHPALRTRSAFPTSSLFQICHRITESQGWKRPTRSSSPTVLPSALLPQALSQISQLFVQAPLEHCQGRRLHHLPAAIPCLTSERKSSCLCPT